MATARTWLLVASTAACGGGSGSPGSDTGANGAPVIRAWLAKFPTGDIPAPGLGGGGGSARLLVTVNDVTAASAAETVVEAGGPTLAYDATAGAWRGWLLLSTRDRLSLMVRRGNQRWSVDADLIDAYPQLVSPRQRDNFPIDFVYAPDAVPGLPIRLSWTGELPSADHQWAVMAMDGAGRMRWPALDRFGLLTDASLRRFDLPAGAAGNDTVGFVAAGVARTTPINGAAAGSALTLAAFSMAELFLPSSDPGIARLDIAPRWISVGVGRKQPLSALGYSNPDTTGPANMQAATTRVAWSTTTRAWRSWTPTRADAWAGPVIVSIGSAGGPTDRMARCRDRTAVVKDGGRAGGVHERHPPDTGHRRRAGTTGGAHDMSAALVRSGSTTSKRTASLFAIAQPWSRSWASIIRSR